MRRAPPLFSPEPVVNSICPRYRASRAHGSRRSTLKTYATSWRKVTGGVTAALVVSVKPIRGQHISASIRTT